MNDSVAERIRKAKEERAPSLSLMYCKLTKLPEELAELTWLVSLTAASSQIQDISVLKHLTNLHFLNLSSNQVEDISVLQHLTRLRLLDLSRNKIKNLEGLEHLINLEKLALDNNLIENIEPLVPLFRLNKMQIGHEVDFYFHTGEVSLRNNPLRHPQGNLIQIGNDVIIAHFEKMKNNEAKS